MCAALSPGPGKVCGKSIEVHCGGKGIVWAADPDGTGQRAEDQCPGGEVMAGMKGDGQKAGYVGTAACPALSPSELIAMSDKRSAVV